MHLLPRSTNGGHAINFTKNEKQIWLPYKRLNHNATISHGHMKITDKI